MYGHQVSQQEPEKGEKPKLAPVVPNSLAWGSFMAVAGNGKYQVRSSGACYNHLQSNMKMWSASADCQWTGRSLAGKRPLEGYLRYQAHLFWGCDVTVTQASLIELPCRTSVALLVQAPFVGSVPLRTGLTAALRYGNCYAGGMMWMWYMQKLGLQ